MAATRKYKVLFLSGLAWDAEDATPPITLYAAIKAAARARLEDTGSGRVLVSTSQNGFSGTFSLPANGAGVSPQDVAELCQELLDHFDAANTTLIARGTAEPTDAQILAEMKLRIQQETARTSMDDFSGLRRG